MIDLSLKILFFIGAYLLGSIPFGLFIGKLIGKVDVREHGSGNIGVSNVLRTVGLVPAIIVLVLDAGKGALPVLLAKQMFPNETLWLLAGFMAIIGHNWPIFLNFKGGRGVATTFGVLLSLIPMVAFWLIIIWVITLAISRYISLSSITAAVAFPILLWIYDHPLSFFVLGLFISIFVIYRHRANIQRLIAGKEFKVGQKVNKN
ncbi:MAG: glycerol-3-phosphate 1-O-acyltransferase PlsY [Firmicutes bacterium]|nr:glycerol-3-phosphate 1-O-acyltransferase PlsY [Bacillota bacterium]